MPGFWLREVGSVCWMAGESDDSYAEIVESLSKVNDLLDRLRAEPPSPKRDAAIERLSSVMVSAMAAVRALGGASTNDGG